MPVFGKDRFGTIIICAALMGGAAGCDDDKDGESSTPDPGEPCSYVPEATNVGEICTDVPLDPLCGTGGTCMDFGSGRFCWQMCVPEDCETSCTVEGEQCLPVVDSTGNPVEIDTGIALGVCGTPPTGTQGLYDPCGTAETGSCQAGLTCLSITAVTGTGAYCSPDCGETVECPELEGVAGACVLTAGGDTEPVNCALLCTVGDTAVCPTGMECYDAGGGGVCLWPEG